MKALGQRGSVRLRINYPTSADLTKLKVELQDFVSNPRDFAFGPFVSKKFGTLFIQWGQQRSRAALQKCKFPAGK
jgi:hypothetical protein